MKIIILTYPVKRYKHITEGNKYLSINNYSIFIINYLIQDELPQFSV